MGTPNVFLIFVLSQAVVISLIVIFLKKKLDKILIDLAITQIEAGRVVPNGVLEIIIITHRAISGRHRDRVIKAFKMHVPGIPEPQFKVNGQILGGMIIKAGTQVVDFSLIDRLRKAKSS